MLKKGVFSLFLVSSAFLIMILSLSCGNQENSHVLKLSLILGENSDWYKGAVRFGELIELKTGGKYKIKIFTHSQLAGQVQRSELEMLQTGVIDMSLESSILLSLIEPAMALPSLPWLFRDYGNAFAVLDGPQGDILLSKLEKKGIMGLAYGANGFRQLTNSKRVVETPADLKSLKIRVPSISLYIDIFKMLDADPSPMNFGELFTALSQGTMDGQENPVSVIYSSRIYDVQKYLTIWNYSYDPVILCINGKLWDSLPTDIKKIFRDCAREAMDYERRLVALNETALIDSLKIRGMEISFPDDSSILKFKKMSELVYRKCAEKTGDFIIKDFIEASEENFAGKR